MAGRKHLHTGWRDKKRLDSLDYIIFFFTFATPLFEVPQLVEIYANRSAQDVSLWTWAFFCLDNLAWMAYAIHRRLLPLLVTSLLYEIFEIGIFVGIILYG